MKHKQAEFQIDVFYKKHVYKKHEAEIRQKLRNIQEAQAGWASNNNLKKLFLPVNFLSN